MLQEAVAAAAQKEREAVEKASASVFPVSGNGKLGVTSWQLTPNANLLHLLDFQRILEFAGSRHKNQECPALQAKAAWEARMADEAHQCLLSWSLSSA